MEVWHVLFPCYVQCVHAFVARSAQLFDLTISTTTVSLQHIRCDTRLASRASRERIVAVIP